MANALLNTDELKSLSYLPKQNQVSAIPQRSPTIRLTEGETRLGWRTTLNPAPRGKHDNMQNTKLTCRKYIQLIWKSYFKYLKMAKVDSVGSEKRFSRSVSCNCLANPAVPNEARSIASEGLLRRTKPTHSIFLPDRAKSLLSERFVWVFPRESPYWVLAMKALLRGKITKVQWLLIENSRVSVLEFVPFDTFCSQSVATLNELPHWQHIPSRGLCIDNRKIRCIYAVLANKIVIFIYLCSCVFMSHFGRDLNPIRDG